MRRITGRRDGERVKWIFPRARILKRYAIKESEATAKRRYCLLKLK